MVDKPCSAQLSTPEMKSASTHRNRAYKRWKRIQHFPDKSAVVNVVKKQIDSTSTDFFRVRHADSFADENALPVGWLYGENNVSVEINRRHYSIYLEPPVENGLSEPSSNPGRDCSYFT